MEISRKLKNIVLIGNFIPYIKVLDKYFFVTNGIVSESDIDNKSVFDSLSGVQLITKKFELYIVFNQFIITSTEPTENESTIIDLTKKILSTANIINITAVGINFHYEGKDDKIKIEELTKKYFYSSEISLFSKYFNTPDSKYGIYASINFGNARIKLDIKPATITDKNSKHDIINFAFNCHFDIINKQSNAEALKYLSEYSKYENETKNIISLYN